MVKDAYLFVECDVPETWVGRDACMVWRSMSRHHLQFVPKLRNPRKSTFMWHCYKDFQSLEFQDRDVQATLTLYAERYFGVCRWGECTERRVTFQGISILPALDIPKPSEMLNWAQHFCSGRSHDFWGLPPFFFSSVGPCYTSQGCAKASAIGDDPKKRYPVCHESPQSLRTQKSSLKIGGDPKLRMECQCTSNFVRYSNIKSVQISDGHLLLTKIFNSGESAPSIPLAEADTRQTVGLGQSTTSVILSKLRLEHCFSESSILLDADNVCTCPWTG